MLNKNYLQQPISLQQPTESSDQSTISFKITALTKLHPTKRRILNYIIHLAQFDVIFPSYATIAKHARVSERQTKRHMSALIKDGYITKLSRPLMPNIYTLNDLFYSEQNINYLMHLLPGLEFLEKKQKNIPIENLVSTTKKPRDVTLLNVIYLFNNQSIIIKSPYGYARARTHVRTSVDEMTKGKEVMDIREVLKQMNFNEQEMEQLSDYSDTVLIHAVSKFKQARGIKSRFNYFIAICKQKESALAQQEPSSPVFSPNPVFQKKVWTAHDITPEQLVRLQERLKFAKRNVKNGKTSLNMYPTEENRRWLNDYEAQLQQREEALASFLPLYEAQFGKTDTAKGEAQISHSIQYDNWVKYFSECMPDEIKEDLINKFIAHPNIFEGNPIVVEVLKNYLNARQASYPDSSKSAINLTLDELF